MNDPHVVALHYVITHGAHITYKDAPPLEHEERDFTVRIEQRRQRLR